MYTFRLRSHDTDVVLMNMITPDIVEYTLLIEMALKYYSDTPIIRIKRDKSLTLIIKEVK